jgi:hypothetical protein
MTEDQLHTTTKRTIAENEQRTTELQYQSRETERIIRLNQELEKKNKELKRKLALSEQAQQMLAKRTQFFQKYIKKLTEKLSQAERDQLQPASHDSELPVESLSSIKSRSLPDAKRKPSSELVRRLEAQLQDQLESTQTLAVENQRLQEQLAGAESASLRILSLQDETTAFILTCIEEIKELQAQAKVKSGHAIIADIEHDSAGPKVAKWHVGQPIPTSLADLSYEERMDIFELLLQKLSFYDSSRRGGRGHTLGPDQPPPLEKVSDSPRGMRGSGLLPAISSRGASRG